MSLPGGSAMVLSSARFAEPVVFSKVLFNKECNVPSTVLVGNGTPLPEPKRKLHTQPFNFSWPFRRVGCGLRNLKNTCFLASVIQCLQHIPVWYNYLIQQHRPWCRENVHKCVVCMLHRLAFESFRTFCAISPTDLVENIKNIGSHMERGQQEDAHDFLLCLLNKMQENLIAGLGKLDPRTEMTTAVGQIFGGYLRSQIVCRGCHHASNSYEPFFNISLEIKAADSLKEALVNFVSPENMEDEEWYPCEVCKEKRRAEKTYTIHELPNVLVIHFKRYSQEGSRQTKLGQHIQFDERIDLSPYLSSASLEPTIFQLNGVLVHMGYNIGSGHYYSYIADPSTTLNGAPTSWHKMNDEYVSMSDWSTVRASQAYILFYSKSNRKCTLTKNAYRRPCAIVTPLKPSNMLSASAVVEAPVKKDNLLTSHSPVFGPVQCPSVVQHQTPLFKSAEETSCDRSELSSSTVCKEAQTISTFQKSRSQKSLMIPRVIVRKQCPTELAVVPKPLDIVIPRPSEAQLSVNSNLLEDEKHLDVPPESNVTAESNLLEAVHQEGDHTVPQNTAVIDNDESAVKTMQLQDAQETSQANASSKQSNPVTHSENRSPFRSAERYRKRNRSLSCDSAGSRKRKRSSSRDVHRVTHRSNHYRYYRHQQNTSGSTRIYRNHSDRGYYRNVRKSRSRSRDYRQRSGVLRRHRSKGFKRRETNSRTPRRYRDKRSPSLHQKSKSPRRKESPSSLKGSKSPRRKESPSSRKDSKSPRCYRESESPRRQKSYQKRYDSRHSNKRHRDRSHRRNRSKRKSSTSRRQ